MSARTIFGGMIGAISTAAVLILTGCTEKLDPTISQDTGYDVPSGIPFTPAAPEIKTITISANPEGTDPATRTYLENPRLKWSENDSFNVMGIGSVTEEVTTPELAPVSVSKLNSMTSNSTKKVMITAVSYNGYVFGSSDSSWSCYANESINYAKHGTGLTDAEYAANEVLMVNTLTSLAKSSKYLFTLTKTDNGFTIKNASGKYLSCSGRSTSWESSGSELTIEQATNSSKTSPVVKQNTTGTVVNPNILRIKSGNKYFQTASSPTLNTDKSSGWTLFYILEINEDPGTHTVTTEYPFNNEFNITDPENGTFTGDIIGGSELNVALYPYSENNTFDNGTVSFSQPQTQHYAQNSFGLGAMPMMGILEDEENITFKNLCGAIKFSLTGNATVNKVTVEDLDSSVNLWGNASIKASDFAGGEYGVTFTKGSNKVILDCGTGVQLGSEPTLFYLTVPAGAFATGFTITLETSDGYFSKTAAVENTIARSLVKSMPTLDITDFEEVEEVLPEYNIMNYMIEDYFNNVNYTLADVDNGTSLFESMGFSSKVGKAGRSHTLDQPKKVDVTWTASGTGTATASLYSDKACTQLVDSGTASVSTGKYSFTDLVPYRTYYYKVTNGSTVLASGGFKTTGQIRMIKIDSSWNIRDLGGWTGLGGKKLKYEMIYRGGDLDRATSAESARLRQLGMMAETDFRVLSDKSEHHTNEGYDEAYVRGETRIQNNDGEVMYYHKCADYATDKGTKTNGTGTILYQREDPDPRMNDVGTLVMHMAFTIHAVNTGHPVYFHCKSGADRTGVFAMLLEGLLGVSPMEIIKEYELTNFSYESEGFDRRHYSSDTAIGKAYRLIRDNAGLGAPASYDTYQKRCYYYFNQYFNSPTCPKRINASDLDAFIMNMLDMGPTEYEQYRPENVYDGGSANTLPSVYYWDCGHDHGWN